MAYLNRDTYLVWVGLFGIVPIVTGTMRWCPANLISGIKPEQKDH